MKQPLGFCRTIVWNNINFPFLFSHRVTFCNVQKHVSAICDLCNNDIQYYLIYLIHISPQRLTCGSGLVLTGHPVSAALAASARPVALSFFASGLWPLQSPLQGFNLLPAPCHLLHKTILHQSGNLIHGSFEDRFHNSRKLGLKRYYCLGHYTNDVWELMWAVFPQRNRLLHGTACSRETYVGHS